MNSKKSLKIPNGYQKL